MISQVLVPQRTEAPSPSDVAAYLRSRDWVNASTSEHWAEYTKVIDSETVTVEIPQKSTARDYARSVGALISDLARLEARSPVELVRDIRAATSDIVRIGVESALTRDGRVPVEAGLRIVEATRNLVLSAACSVIEPRAVFAARKPDEAMRLLNSARFGQTEVGSFVLTIECKLAPRLENAIESADLDIPFERRTTLKLAQALLGAESASRESAASNQMDPFRRRKLEGLSANLCESLADLISAAQADRVWAAFSFASCRPANLVLPRSPSFSSDDGLLLREAARQLRYETPLVGFDALGPVVKLHSRDANQGGEIVIHALVDGKPRAVRVSLPADFYQSAVDAHREGTLVRCTGDLARDGRTWVIRSPRELAFVTVDED